MGLKPLTKLLRQYHDSFSCTISILPFPLKEKIKPRPFPLFNVVLFYKKPSCVILLLPEIILGKVIRENGHSSGNGFHLSHF